jgi:predicted DsbA family dithiol-disulfide isomerase
MTKTLKIDFVSDVSCPWCVIGLRALQQAADRLKDEVTLDLHFQPFELNPQMGPQGQDIGEHLQQKYGASAEQREATRAAIAARGAELGFTFTPGARGRIYNTFDAHRLLHWAELQGCQLALKQALFKAYFTDGQDPSNHDLLVRVAGGVGLNEDEARDAAGVRPLRRPRCVTRAVLPAARHSLGARHRHQRPPPPLRAASRSKCSSRRCGRLLPQGMRFLLFKINSCMALWVSARADFIKKPTGCPM